MRGGGAARRSALGGAQPCTYARTYESQAVCGSVLFSGLTYRRMGGRGGAAQVGCMAGLAYE